MLQGLYGRIKLSEKKISPAKSKTKSNGRLRQLIILSQSHISPPFIGNNKMTAVQAGRQLCNVLIQDINNGRSFIDEFTEVTKKNLEVNIF